MPRSVIQYRCLLISPSDVHREREALSDLVTKWNAHVGQALGALVELVRWETHSAPDSSAPPQAALNSQVVDDSDFGIAVFWTRLGTATESAQSGSIEEVRRLVQRGARVLIYFSSAPVPQERLADDQFQQLQQFKAEVQQGALVGSYARLEELREQVQLHLTTTVAKLLEADRSQPSPDATASGVLTAPIPDVRVQVAAAMVMPGPETVDVLSVTVQNHSPMVVYIASVALALANQKRLYAPRDVITGEFQRRRALQPGESFSFMMSPAELSKHATGAQVRCAVATDDIGRVFESSEESMRIALKNLKIIKS